MFQEIDYPAQRDRSRQPSRKRADLSRRAARQAKSARLFLAFAFPADLAAFEGAR
jgi:hypothetical protein